MVIVDTSAWYAFFLPTDPYHQHVRTWFASSTEPLLTTDYCVDETLTLLTMRREHRRALEAGRAFFQGGIAALHFVTPDQVRRTWIVFEQRSAHGWSVTDCTSKVVIDEL